MPITASILSARRGRAASAWGASGVPSMPVVIGAGRPIPIPGGADQTFPFRAHPHYRWLTGRDRPRGVVAFDHREGWREFLPETSEAERLWEGAEPTTPADAAPLGALSEWLDAHAAGAGRYAALGAPTEEVDRQGRIADGASSAILDAWLLHARRPKDDAELAVMRRAAQATAAGYVAARAALRPGVSERAVAIELEAAMFRAGGDRTAYDTIVASGPRSAVLHGLPTSRLIGSDDIVLIDAGVEIDGYCADVTRVFPASGRFTAEQQALIDVVEPVRAAAVARCRPGVEWRDVHTAAARELAAGLVSIGLLRGAADDRVADESIALFFPHGIGHMVGLGVRDAGGRLPGAAGDPRRCCGVLLRVDLPLERGYAMTVEPGLYLVPALLRDAGRRARFGDRVGWELADRWLDRGVGGVRLEDNVIVGDGPAEVVTGMIPLPAAAVSVGSGAA